MPSYIKRQRKPSARDFTTMTDKELKAMWMAWYPTDQPQTTEERQVCTLIEAVALLRGFDTSTWDE